MLETAPDPRRWWALALLCGAFFMVILDAATHNTVEPERSKRCGSRSSGPAVEPEGS